MDDDEASKNEAVKQKLHDSVDLLVKQGRLHISDLLNAHAHDNSLYLDPLFLSLLGFSSADRQSLYDTCVLSDNEAFEYLAVFSIEINKPKTLTHDERYFLGTLRALSGFGAENVPLADTPRKKEVLRQFRKEVLAYEAACTSGW